MSDSPEKGSLVGLHINSDGVLHTAWRDSSGQTTETTEPWTPFFWTQAGVDLPSTEITELSGAGNWSRRAAFDEFSEFSTCLKDTSLKGRIESCLSI